MPTAAKVLLPLVSPEWVSACATVAIHIANVVYVIVARRQLGALKAQAKMVDIDASGARWLRRGECGE